MKKIYAFPFQVTEYNAYYNKDEVSTEEGMELRDYFAAKALQGLLAQPDLSFAHNENTVAENAYVYADAMMKARTP